jgi:hypothetical protein
MTNQEIHNRLREAARSLGFANIAIASNDVSEALRDLAEVCLDIAAVYEWLIPLSQVSVDVVCATA